MEITEKRTETVEREVHIKTICDLCKEEIPQQGRYEVREIDVSMRIGLHQPSSEASGTYWEYDVCKKCFMFKILPIFKEAGCDVSGEGY